LNDSIETGNGHSAHGDSSGDPAAHSLADAAQSGVSTASAEQVALLGERPWTDVDAWDSDPEPAGTDAPFVADEEEPYTAPRVDGVRDLDAGLPAWSGEVAPMHVAVARERVFQAARRLQEARADQYETLLPIRARRAELDVDRIALATEAESDAVAHQRLDDAYHDYVTATRLFDEEFRTILDMLEQVTRRRAVRKWWKRALRRLGGQSAADLEAAVVLTKLEREAAPDAA
jgi:hypothetical protein